MSIPGNRHGARSDGREAPTESFPLAYTTALVQHQPDVIEVQFSSVPTFILHLLQCKQDGVKRVPLNVSDYTRQATPPGVYSLRIQTYML